MVLYENYVYLFGHVKFWSLKKCPTELVKTVSTYLFTKYYLISINEVGWIVNVLHVNWQRGHQWLGWMGGENVERHVYTLVIMETQEKRNGYYGGFSNQRGKINLP